MTLSYVLGKTIFLSNNCAATAVEDIAQVLKEVFERQLAVFVALVQDSCYTTEAKRPTI